MRSNPTSEQILFFSDAVIAITITLLMLEVRLPAGAGELADPALLDALLATSGKLLGYVVSFLVIASFWISHHRKFHHIARTDGMLVWLNFLFLLTIGLIPFATSVISDNGGSVATIFYAGTIVLSALSLTLLWVYAWRRGLTDLEGAGAGGLLYPTLMPAAVFALSMLVALKWPDAAKYSWLLIIPLAMLQRRLPGMG